MALELDRADELISSRAFTAGAGDGAVSIASARLDGVSDFQTLPIRHVDWAVTTKPEIENLVLVVSNKLKAASPEHEGSN